MYCTIYIHSIYNEWDYVGPNSLSVKPILHKGLGEKNTCDQTLSQQPQKNTLGCFVKVYAFVWACDCSLYVCIPNISPPMFGPQDSYIETYLSIYTFIFLLLWLMLVFSKEEAQPSKYIFFLDLSYLDKHFL